MKTGYLVWQFGRNCIGGDCHDKTKRAHLITGGYPAGSDAGHDVNYARLRLLEILAERDGLEVTFAMDFRDIGRWLRKQTCW